MIFLYYFLTRNKRRIFKEDNEAEIFFGDLVLKGVKLQTASKGGKYVTASDCERAYENLPKSMILYKAYKEGRLSNQA